MTKPKRHKAEKIQRAHDLAKKCQRRAEAAERLMAVEQGIWKEHFRAKARQHWSHFDKLTLWIYRAEGHQIVLAEKRT